EPDTGKRRHCFEHPNKVWAVAFSPDGRWLASGDLGGHVFLRDSASGQLLPGYPRQIDCVKCLAFSGDGRLLALGCVDGIVHFWDLRSGKRLREQVAPAETDVLSLAFAPDSQTLACGCYHGQVCLWDCARGRSVRSLLHAAPTARQRTSL